MRSSEKTKKTYIIDGVVSQLTQLDLNNDGKIDEIELLKPINSSYMPNSSEIQGSFKEINRDTIEDNNMSTIDTRSNILSEEIDSILSYDFLTDIGFMPTKLGYLTRKKLRLSISKNARSRDDMVKIAQGVNKAKEDKKQGKILKAIKNFSGAEKKQE